MATAKKKAATKKAKRSVTPEVAISVSVTTPDGKKHTGDIRILNAHACMLAPVRNNGEALIEGFRESLKMKFGRGFVE